MTIKAKLSKQVANQFPEFFKEDGPNFLAFIEGYYEYMEQNGKLTDAIQSLEDYKDINTTLDEYLTHFQETLLPSVPQDVLSDKRLMAKYVKYYNETRGSLASYKLLFRSIYNEDVEVNYPADQMLKISDGDWQLDRYLVTSYNQKNYEFIGKTIVGTESNSQALVEDVVGRVVRGRDLMQINVSNVKGSFNHLEPIRLLSDTNGAGYSTIVEAGINRIEIVSAGAKYQAGDVVNIESDKIGDFGKVVVTDTVDLGGSLTFTIVEGGSGYTASTAEPNQGGTTVTLSGGDGDTPASFSIAASDIGDTFSISQNVTLLGANNLFGVLGPTVINADYGARQMSTFAHTIIGAPTIGFPESNQVTTKLNYRDNFDSSLNIASTAGIAQGSSLFGVSSGANATVTSVADATVGDAWFITEGYRKFIASIYNRVNYSEQFDNAYWTKTGSTVTANQTVAPDGTTTADKMIEDTSNGAHLITIASSFLQNSTAYSFSVHLKAGSTTRNAALRFVTNSTNHVLKVNLQDGSTISTGGTLAASSVKSVGNGWYRVSITVTAASSGTHNLQIRMIDSTSSNISYQGVAASHMFVWGAQVETAAAPTNYQRVVADAFGTGETVTVGTAAGSSVGKVSSFAGNTVGYHILDIANTGGQTIALGDEIVSTTNFYANTADTTLTGEEVFTYGVIKKIISTTPYLYQHEPAANVVQSGTVSGGDTSTSPANTVTKTGIGTAFSRGDAIKAGGQGVRRVVSVAGDNNSLVVTPAFDPPLSSAAYGKGGVFRTLIKCRVSANNSANVSNQFDFGPLQGYVEGDGLRKVGATTIVGNVHLTTSNTEYENVYTKLSDSLVFKTLTFGTIEDISSRVGGSGFTVAPNVSVVEGGIAALGIGEQYLTLEADTSAAVTVDTNDGLVQGSASGDIKAGAGGNDAPSVRLRADGKYETVVRVWQKPLQREPNLISFTNNANITVNRYSSSYVAGTIDTRSVASTATAKIIKIVDKGVLGKNAQVSSQVGADGTITAFRVVDSGYSYDQNEKVKIQSSGRTDSTQAVVKLSLQNAANSEGYYATSRSQISTKRGFIQDSDFYQEFSYELAVPLSLKRYKDIAMKLAHPAGQKMFGKYKSHSNASVNIAASETNTFRRNATGTFTLTAGSVNVAGTGTTMLSQFSSGGDIIIKISSGVYYKVPLNIVSADNAATLRTAWSNSTITTTAQYTTGFID
jgi:hypothetical protein